MKHLIVFLVSALCTGIGCVATVHTDDSHAHDEACGHFYWHGAWYGTPHSTDCVDAQWHVHVHSDGCGHFHWHGHWSDIPHPDDCNDPKFHGRHHHGWGCGHYYWHGAWNDTPHLSGCFACCVHYRGCGHFYWHGEWHDAAHLSGCGDPAWHGTLHVHRDG